MGAVGPPPGALTARMLSMVEAREGNGGLLGEGDFSRGSSSSSTLTKNKPRLASPVGRVLYAKLKGDLLLRDLQEAKREQDSEVSVRELGQKVVTLYERALEACDHDNLPGTHFLRLQLALCHSRVLDEYLDRPVDAWYAAIGAYEASSERTSSLDPVEKLTLHYLRCQLSRLSQTVKRCERDSIVGKGGAFSLD